MNNIFRDIKPIHKYKLKKEDFYKVSEHCGFCGNRTVEKRNTFRIVLLNSNKVCYESGCLVQMILPDKKKYIARFVTYWDYKHTWELVPMEDKEHIRHWMTSPFWWDTNPFENAA